ESHLLLASVEGDGALTNGERRLSRTLVILQGGPRRERNEVRSQGRRVVTEQFGRAAPVRGLPRSVEVFPAERGQIKDVHGRTALYPLSQAFRPPYSPTPWPCSGGARRPFPRCPTLPRRVAL